MSILNTIWQDRAVKDGYQAAFNELLKRHVADQDHYRQLESTRFYVKVDGNPDENQPARLVAVSERRVSEGFDMADCHGEQEFMWLDDEFKLHPVTCRNLGSGMSMGAADEWQQENPRSILSWSGELIANGQVVGSVTFTDH